jgi:hypothetical protein
LADDSRKTNMKLTVSSRRAVIIYHSPYEWKIENGVINVVS